MNKSSKIHLLFIILLLAAVFLLSACDEMAEITLYNIEHNAPLTELGVVNTNSHIWVQDGRFIDINDYVTAEEFVRIVDFILANGQMGVHGTLYGALPFYYFDPMTAWLIPDWDWFWSEAESGGFPLDSNWNEGWPIPDAWNSDNFNEISWLSTSSTRRPFYGVYRETYSDGSPTGNFILVVSWADEEITDEQFLTQFRQYLDMMLGAVR